MPFDFFLDTTYIDRVSLTRPYPSYLSLSQINEKAPKNCHYPEHGTPACVNDNPCSFTCTDGFTADPPANPTDCVCNAPQVICNGICQAAGACPSSQPVSDKKKKKRSWVGSGSCTDMGPGWAACGVFGGGPRAWECVDTARDLESCSCLYHLSAPPPQTDLLFSFLLKAVVACSPLRSTPPLARIALRSPASQTFPAWQANVSSTAAYRVTCPLHRAASASSTTTNTTTSMPLWRRLRRRTCPRGSMDSNTFPSRGTERVFCGGFSAPFLHPDTYTTPTDFQLDFQTIFRTTTFLFIVQYLSLLSVSHQSPLGLVLCCRLGREPLLLYSTQYCIPSVTFAANDQKQCLCAAVNFTLSE
jgi:hypothetical protein